jgi:hypothetical protein
MLDLGNLVHMLQADGADGALDRIPNRRAVRTRLSLLSWFFIGPGTFPAPRILLLVGSTPAALSSSVAVGGVRNEKLKERSGRTVMRAGIGVPGV